MTALETTDEWHARYDASRRALGHYSKASSWRTWISPRIGDKPWIEVTSDDLEAIRDDLDAAIARRVTGSIGKRALLGRTAIDVWSDLSAAVKAARRSKQRDLRALAGLPSPIADIEPPGTPQTRGRRRKPFLYPTEFLRLVSCGSIPRDRRRLYAIAAYTYLRPGELLTLRWDDIDLAAGVIHVTRAWHYERLEVKPPKTISGVRDVPIHPHLAPLLKRLSARVQPGDLVVPTISQYHRVTWPIVLRDDLRRAGILRSALHESSLVTIHATFRSLRDTGITWLAMAGTDLLRIMRRAGHGDSRTTVRYVKQAEDVTGKMGTPFPVLPKGVTG